MRKWHKWYDECVDCGTRTKPYQAKGRCANCYYKHAWHSNPERQKKHKILMIAWRKKNPEAWAEIVARAGIKWRAKNIKKLRKYSKDYYHAHKITKK